MERPWVDCILKLFNVPIKKSLLLVGVLVFAGCAPTSKVASTDATSPSTTLGSVVPFEIGSGGSINKHCPSNSSCIFPSAGFPGICKTLPQPTKAIISEGMPKSSILPGESLDGNSNQFPKTISDKSTLATLFRDNCQIFPLFQPFISFSCPISSGWTYQIVFAMGNRAYARVFIGRTNCDGLAFADGAGIYWAFPHWDESDYTEVRDSLASALGVTENSLFKS